MASCTRSTLLLVLVALLFSGLTSGCGDDDEGAGTVEPDPGGVEDWTGVWQRTLTVAPCPPTDARRAAEVDTFLVCSDGAADDVIDLEGDDGLFWLCEDFTWTSDTARLVCNARVSDVAFLNCVFQYTVDVTVERDGDSFTWDARVDWSPIEGCDDDLLAGCLVQTGTGTRLSRDVEACEASEPTDLDYDLTITDDTGATPFAPASVRADRILGRTFVSARVVDDGRERILNLSIPITDTARTLPLVSLPDTLAADLPDDEAVVFYLDLRSGDGSDAWLLDAFAGTIEFTDRAEEFEATIRGSGTLEQLEVDPAPTASIEIDGDLRVPVRVLALPRTVDPARLRAAELVDRVLRRAFVR